MKRKKIVIIIAVIIAIVTSVIISGRGTAHAIAIQPKPTIVYTTTCTGTVGGLCPGSTPSTNRSIGVQTNAQVGGGCCSPRGSGSGTVTLTRQECYILFCLTDYQAHLTLNYSWDINAYGGVVFNTSQLLLVDHLKASFSADPPTYTNGYFTWTSPFYHTTSAYGGYYVHGYVNVHQCFAACVQTESVAAYVHGRDDGSWIADITHS